MSSYTVWRQEVYLKDEDSPVRVEYAAHIDDYTSQFSKRDIVVSAAGKTIGGTLADLVSEMPRVTRMYSDNTSRDVLEVPGIKNLIGLEIYVADDGIYFRKPLTEDEMMRILNAILHSNAIHKYPL